MELKVKIKYRWWFKLIYLPLLFKLIGFVRLHINADIDPNMDRVEYWVKKGIKLEV